MLCTSNRNSWEYLYPGSAVALPALQFPSSVYESYLEKRCAHSQSPHVPRKWTPWAKTLHNWCLWQTRPFLYVPREAKTKQPGQIFGGRRALHHSSCTIASKLSSLESGDTHPRCERYWKWLGLLIFKMIWKVPFGNAMCSMLLDYNFHCNQRNWIFEYHPKSLLKFYLKKVLETKKQDRK